MRVDTQALPSCVVDTQAPLDTEDLQLEPLGFVDADAVKVVTDDLTDPQSIQRRDAARAAPAQSASGKVSKNARHDGPVGELDGDRLVQIAPGRYEATFVRHELRSLYGGGALKLVLWFRVVSPGQAFGVSVPKYYNVKKRAGSSERGQSFVVGGKSDFFRDYVRLLDLMPQRKDRMSPDRFRGKVFEVQVRFVERDSKQNRIAKGARYTVIDQIIRIAT